MPRWLVAIVIFVVSWLVLMIFTLSRQGFVTEANLYARAGTAFAITLGYIIYLSVTKEKPKITEEAIEDNISQLSGEELQVLQILYEAIQNSTKSTLDISNALGISHIEARRLKQGLRKKMGVETNEELVKLAEEKGLINISEQSAEETQ